MLLFCLLLAVLTSPFALATPTVISDQRIRDSTLTPALGRGYSLTTYDVLSTCLTFKEKTEPTYNFAYDFHEVGTHGNLSSHSQAAMTGSLSYSFIQTSIKRALLNAKATNATSMFTVMTMSMERYYSSIEDTTAELTPHALNIIESGNLVAFFAACGSGYIRSIRRSAEMTAIFEYTSSSANEVSELAASMTRRLRDIRTGVDSNVSRSSSLTSSEMTITIRAFGLGLNIDGASDLVATSLEDYQEAVHFAFKSMQSEDIGIVKSVEVVPWTNNLQFNDAVVFEATEAIDFDDAGVQLIGTGGQINAKTGKYDVALDADGNPTTTIDESKNQILAGIEVKAITTINAEFITYLEGIYSDKVHYLSLAFQCSKVLHGYMHRDTLKRKILVDQSRSTFDSPRSSSDCGSTEYFTVEQVGAWFTLEQLIASSLQAQNFITEYYGPCASAITKFSRNGRMTKYWWELPSCYETICPPAMVAQVTRHKTNNTYARECVAMAKPAEATPAAPVDTLELLVDSFCMPQFDEVATEVCALITAYWDGVRDGVERTCEAYCQELGGSGACT